jgi:hypothetical protein
MDDTGHTGDQSGGDEAALDRARRIETLHRLAQTAAAAQPSQPARPETTRPPIATGSVGTIAPATPPTPARRPPVRRLRRPALWISAVAIMLCAAVVVSLVLRATATPSRQAARPATVGPVVIRPALDGLTCLRDAAWSPTGARVAVLGSVPADSCPSAGLLNIYDTAGKMTAHIQLDSTVLTALAAMPGVPRDTPAAFYTHALWSPDGTTLAVTGFITFPNIVPPTTAPNYTFLLLVGADGSRARASLVSSSGIIPGVLWNLTTTPAAGMILPDRSTLGRLSSLVNVVPPVTPAALGYQWSPAGALMPTQPLSAQSAPAPGPLAPVGNPARDAGFTVWQPGQAELQIFPLALGGPPSFTFGTGVYTWAAVFATWSPDDHYLLDGVSVFDRIQPPGLQDATPQRADELGLKGIPVLPLRDAALGTVFSGMQTDTQDISQHIALAWRPDGRTLAATSLYRQLPSPFAPTSAPPHVVTLYDCASGHMLASLPIPSYVITDPIDVSALRWSIDGTHLLLYEASTTTIVLWGPGQLPPR